MPMIHFLVDVRSLQLYLKNLQEKGFFSFEREFNFSSIDRRDLFNFWAHPTNLVKLQIGEDARPIPPQGFASKVFDFESSPPSPLISNDGLGTHGEIDSSSNPFTHSPSLSISDHDLEKPTLTSFF